MRVCQSRREFAAALALGLLPAQALAQARIVKGRNSRIPPPPDEAPYQPPTDLGAIADLFRRMTGPVSINDKGPFPFVVDTGANQSVLSEELAAQLKLPSGDVQPLHGVAGVQMARTVVASQLRIGGRTLEQVILSVLSAEAVGGLGMLGIDVLYNQRLTLDFRAKRLRIERSRAGFGDFDVAVPGHQKDGQLTIIDARIDGQPVKAFLDSGAQSTIGNTALQALAIRESQESRLVRVPIVSATGQTIAGERAILPDVEVGRMKLRGLPVVFSDLHTFRMWNLLDQPALLLGVDVLSQFSAVSIDFQRSEVQFRLADA